MADCKHCIHGHNVAGVKMKKYKHPRESEIIQLANLLFKLDNTEHTIPYEAWAEQIIDEGYTKVL